MTSIPVASSIVILGTLVVELMSGPISLLLSTAKVFRYRLLGGLSWNLISVASLQGSVLLSSIILARLLGLEDFGAYSVVATTAMAAAGVVQGGIGLAATKFIGEYLSLDPLRVARILNACALVASLTGLAAAAVLVISSGTIAEVILAQPQIAGLLGWSAVATLFQVIVTYQYGALQGFGAFREISRCGLVSGLLHLVAVTVGGWQFGLPGALLGFAASSASRALVFGFMLVSVRRGNAVPTAAGFNRNDWRLVRSFAVPAGLASLVTLPCLWGVTALVARQPDGLALVAVFAAAQQIRLAILQVPALLNSVTFSVLSRIKGHGELSGYRQVFLANVAATFALAVGIVALVATAAEPVLSVFGSEFRGGRVVLLIMLASVIPEVAALTAYQLVQSAGRMWHSLILIVAPRDLGYLLLALWWMPSLGVEGAAWAYLAGQVIGCLATLGLSWHLWLLLGRETQPAPLT